MKAAFNLSAHRLSRAFWETVFESAYEQLPEAMAAIRANYERCERFRSRADYNTGSITVAAGVCLFALCLHFRVKRIVEVGTYIGKSTSSMALALSRNYPDGVIYTCDKDNACFEPWETLGCGVRTFPRSSSTQMLAELARTPEPVDLFFFDGRVQPDDLPLLRQLTHDGTLFAFDDFEGTEKGVVNVLNLRPALPHHILIEPCPTAVLQQYGVQGRSLISLLLNVQSLSVTNQ